MSRLNYTRQDTFYAILCLRMVGHQGSLGEWILAPAPGADGTEVAEYSRILSDTKSINTNIFVNGCKAHEDVDWSQVRLKRQMRRL